MAAVGAAREVGLVGARAVVVGAARADGQAQGHGVQAARVVAGQLQPLDVRGQAGGLAADRSAARRLPRASSSPSAPRRSTRAPIASSDRLAVAEPQRPARSVEPAVDPASLGAFHQEGDRRAGADRVEPRVVAGPAAPQHGGRVVDAAERPEREERLVLQPDAARPAPAA